jgi:hypothetical protein
MSVPLYNTCLEWAVELLSRRNLWPVAIKPGGKAPIGESWGSTRPTERSLRETFKRFPKAGLGLLLGPEAGIIDIECDGPEGEDSLAKLMGGEIVRTLGWSSARGPHHVFRYDTRLARYRKSIIKVPELPGLEIRIGGSGKQLQSNCPPTLGTDERPREWNGVWEIAELPDAVFAFLDEILVTPRPELENVARALTHTAPSTRYAAKALDKECQNVALAIDGEQNEILNKAAFNLGQLVGAGTLERSVVERRLLDAADGYIEKDGERAARATIESGLNAGQSHPRDLSHKITDAYKAGPNHDSMACSSSKRSKGPSSNGKIEYQAGEVNEAADDPHRLARIHFAKCEHQDKPTLRHYRGEWLRWNGRAYRVTIEPELQSSTTDTTKNEFDRINRIAIELWERDNGA